MKPNRLLATALIMLFASTITSCVKPGRKQSTELSVRAIMPGSEKWDDGDILYMNGRPGNLVKREQEGKTAIFKFACEEPNTELYTFYAPDGSQTDFNRIYFPPARNNDSGNIGWKQSPMFGYTSSADENITMNPLAAILRIELEDIDYLSSVSLTSRSGERLSGIFRLNVKTGRMDSVSGSSTSMMITYNQGLHAENSRIYLSIPVPAQKYAKGFELTAHLKGSKTAVFLIKSEGFDAAAGSVIPTAPDIPQDPEDPEPPVISNEITVASYNVLVSEGRIEAMSMPNSAKSLGENMVQTGADILVLNEIDETLATSSMYSLSRIGEEAGMDNYSWHIRFPSRVMDDRSLQYYYSNGFAYNNMTLECLESEMMWFTTAATVTATKETAKTSHVSKYCNMICGRFRHKATGIEFYMIATHLPLSSDGTSSGYATGQHACFCATAINNFVKAKDESAPWVLLGDLNACNIYSSSDDTNYKAYHTLTADWKDVYDELASRNTLDNFYRKYNGTLSGSSSKYHYDVYTFTNNQPSRRIDHIMVRNCTALSYSTLMSGYMYKGTKYCPSDHIPVIATISLK